MQRRVGLALLVAMSVGAGTGCQQEQAPASGAAGQKQDIKTMAASLQTRTTAVIDAINARNDQRITTTKADLAKEADRVEDAIKSETGAAANRVNSAINRIRPALLNNNVSQLEQARDLLQQAQQS